MNAAAQHLHHALDPGSSIFRPDSRYILPSGNRMPLLGLGTWELRHRTEEIVTAALDAGYRLFDTSGDYHTQHGIGAALHASGVPRESVYLVTKIEEGEGCQDAARRNLAELRTDYADLVLLRHAGDDGIGETQWRDLRRARSEGMARDIGVTNYSIEQIEELVYRTGEMPAVNQIEWSPFGHSPRMLDFCRDNDIVIQAGSPLTRATRLNDDKIAQMAARYGKTPAQLLLRWSLQMGVVPLPKANTPQHLGENLRAFTFEISAQDMLGLRALNQHYSAQGNLRYL
jgi:2,5-diketo-D-gluconate reductase A